MLCCISPTTGEFTARSMDSRDSTPVRAFVWARNQFDDLNQNLRSSAQFVSFSQHPTDVNTLLGGTQDNGSPATSQATTNLELGECSGWRRRV